MASEAESQLESFSGTVSDLSDNMSDLGSNSSSTFENLGKAVSGFATMFSSVFSTLSSLFSGFVSAASAGIQGLMGLLDGLWSMLNIGANLLWALGSAGGKAFETLIDIGKKWLEILDEVRKVLQRLVKSIVTIGGRLRSMLDEWTTAFVFVQLDIRHILVLMRRFAMATSGAIAAGTAAASSFEEQFVVVRRVVDNTSSSLDELGRNLREMSTDVVTSANEMAELASVAGRLGFNSTENIEEFTDVMSKLTMTTNIAGEEGATQFARLLRLTGESMGNMERLASVVVELGNSFAVFEDELLTMAMRVAGPAASIGLASEEILALSAAMGEAGIRAELGGSAMSRIIMQIREAAEEGGDQLESFANIAGVTSDEFVNFVEEDPAKAIEGFVSGLGRMNEEGENVNSVLEDVNLSQIRTRDVLLRLMRSEDLLNETLQTSSEEWENANALAEESATRHETLWAQIQMLKDEVYEAGRALAQPFLERMKEVVATVRTGVRVFRDLSPEQKSVITGFVSLTATLTTFVTAVLMTVRALFTLMTGFTLLARFALWIAPIVAAIWLAKEALDALGLEFEGIGEVIDDFVDAMSKGKDIIEEVLEALTDSELWKEGVKNVRDTAREIGDIWEDDELSTEIKLVDTSTVSVEGLTNTVELIREQIQKASDILREQPEEDWSIDEDENSLAKSFLDLGESIAEFFQEGFGLAFLDLPDLILALAERSGLYGTAGEMGKEFWKRFTEDWIPDWTEDINEMSESVRDFAEQLDFSSNREEDWLENSIEETDLLEDFGEFESFIKAFLNLFSALLELGKEFAIELAEVIEDSVDWEEVGENILEAIGEGMDGAGGLIADKIRKDFEDRTTLEDPESTEELLDIDVKARLESIMSEFDVFSQASAQNLEEGLLSSLEESSVDKSKVKDFISKYGEAAVEAAEELDTKPDYILSQWALESNWGESELSEKYNNLGGIKAMSGRKAVDMDTEEVLEGQRRQLEDSFAVFEDSEDYSEVYSSLIKEKWSEVETAGSAKEFGQLLTPEGGEEYATEENYGEMLQEVHKYMFPEGVEDPSRRERGRENSLNQLVSSLVEDFKELSNIEKPDWFEWETPEWVKELSRRLGTIKRGLSDTLSSSWIGDIKSGEGFQRGGMVGGSGRGDKIPAMLEPGEAVIPRDVVSSGMEGIYRWFKQHATGYQEGTTGSFRELFGEEAGDQVLNTLESSEEDMDEMVSWMEDLQETIIEVVADSTDYVLDLLNTIIDTGVWIAKLLTSDKTDEEIERQAEWIRDRIEDVANTGSTFFEELSQEDSEDEEEDDDDDEKDEEDDKEDKDDEDKAPSYDNLTKAFEQIREATTFLFEDFMLDTVMHPMGLLAENALSAGKSLYDVYENSDSFEEGFFSSIDVLRSGFSSVIDDISVPDIADNLAKLGNAVGGISSDLISESGEFGDAIDNIRESLADTAGEGYKASDSLFSLVKAGDPVKALFQVLVNLIPETEAYKDFLDLVSDAFADLARRLNPLVEALIPILESSLNALVKLLQVFIGIMLILTPILENLIVPALETFANIFEFVAEVIKEFWNGLMDIISKIPGVDMDKYKVELDNATESTKDFNETLEEATRNVPSGFRVGRAVWAASGPETSKVESVSSREAQETITQSGQSNLTINFNDRVYGVEDFEEIVREISKEGERRDNYRESGSPTKSSSRYNR